MKELVVEIIGLEPPCKMCQDTLKNVEEAASVLRASENDVYE